MISNKLSPSLFGRSLSIQSRFPEMWSIDDPCYEYPEDNDISIGIDLPCDHMGHYDGNCLNIADHGIFPSSSSAKPLFALSHSLPPEWSDPCLAVSGIQNSNSQQHQAISNSTIVPEVLGCDELMVTNPSFRQVDRLHPLTGQIPNSDERLITRAADGFGSFHLSAAPYSDTISADGFGSFHLSAAPYSDTISADGFGSFHLSAAPYSDTISADGFGSFHLSAAPYSDTISGEIKSNGLKAYVNLYLAALKGDWETAKEFLNSDQPAICARITRHSETALHIAAGARHTRFVKELVKLMMPDDLAIQNKVGNTALCFAAASGITKIAELMVNKNNNLPLIRGSNGATPLYMATLLGHRDMVWYLFSVTEVDDLTEEDRVRLLVAAITSNLFDVALGIIRCYPELATARDGNGDTALHVLARKPSAFYSGSKLGIWRRCIYSCLHAELPSNSLLFSRSQGQLAQSISHVPPTWKELLLKDPKFLVPGFKAIYEQKLMHIQALELVKQLWEQILLLDDSEIGELISTPSRLLFTAAEFGIVEFMTVLIRSYPDLIWKVNNQSRSIFHIAVAHRQEEIFNLIHEIGALKDLIAAYKDENNNNMLHLAGKLAPPNRLNIDSGAALQLRRELQWFKEVEKIIQPLYTEMKDSEGRTPQILFTEEHKGLVREGEKWMKDTASSCMVVATLIATVMFSAAFTVPGGYNNTGRAIFLTKRSFLVFAVSDALALFSSASSILIFLSILTSRYAEEDFLESLPSRLIIGLATLFISIATMMIAFCATLFLVLEHEFAWVAIPMTLVACIPVNLFALLQFPLFVDMISHIYRSSFIFRPNNHLLY